MIQIVWQNKEIVVCDKPALVLSVPSRDRNDPRPCLGLELQNYLGQQVYPVHRLDFEVSGLIIFALNEKSHRETQSWFSQKLIQKKYMALTPQQSFSHWPEHIQTERQLIPPQTGLEFVWKTQLFKGKKRAFESAHGEWAETKAKIVGLERRNAAQDRVKNDTQNDIKDGVKEGPLFLSWELYPITGKSHQLRFELSRRGFPIVGDQLYGSQLSAADFQESGILLRAVELELGSVNQSLGLPKNISIPHRRT